MILARNILPVCRQSTSLLRLIWSCWLKCVQEQKLQRQQEHDERQFTSVQSLMEMSVRLSLSLSICLSSSVKEHGWHPRSVWNMDWLRIIQSLAKKSEARRWQKQKLTRKEILRCVYFFSFESIWEKQEICRYFLIIVASLAVFRLLFVFVFLLT